MAGGAGRDDDEMITAINVTPLVDVVLVLLVVLMVTASYLVSSGIPLDLPSAASGAPTRPRSISISIDREGAIYLDAVPTDEMRLCSAVRTYVAEVTETEARATIAADAAVAHGQVVRIMDLLRREHVAHFAINVQPENLAP